MREKRVEAASRNEAMAALKAQGIVPIRVDAISGAAAQRRRAGNGESAASRRSAAYVLAVAFVILVGGGLWWWLGGVRGESALPPEKPKTAAIYKEADGAGTTASRVVPAPSPSPVSHIPSKTKSIDTSPPGLVPADVSPVNVMTNHGGSKPHPFRNGTEQVIAWIFSCPIGDMPPFLPDLPESEMADMANIIDSPNHAADGDSEDVLAVKGTIAAVKEELKAYLANGGSAKEFLKFYHGKLMEAHQKKLLAREELSRIAKEEPKLAVGFRDEVNKWLRSNGIDGVDFTAREKRTVCADEQESANEKQEE